MKKIYLLFGYALILFGLALSGCQFESTSAPGSGGTVTLSGQVVESSTGNPIYNASIIISGGVSEQGAVTNSSGKYSVDVDIDQSKELTVVTKMTGYDPDTTKIFVSAGSTINVPVVKLKMQDGTSGSTSGKAASIYLYSQSDESIGVKESGSNETAKIIFELLDASGTPIDINNAVTVNFKFGSNPGGGEYLYPASVKSNALGRASVTLNTGTKAGVAQIIAQTVVNGKTIISKPVLIAIHGGFPDANHFDVACQKLNYPELGKVGYSIDFTAYVGDKYSNPVRTGTSVYFNASSGIIEGSNQTDNLGMSTVTYLTQPYPDLKETGYGPGFFRVNATTVNENNNNIQASTVRLLSGLPIITVAPTSVNIPNGGSQTFNYTVSDQNGNPMSEGQSISVSVTEGNLKVYGDTDVKLLDTQSKSFTSFSFSAYDAQPDTTLAQPVTIEIRTTGPNGDKKITITGTSK